MISAVVSEHSVPVPITWSIRLPSSTPVSEQAWILTLLTSGKGMGGKADKQAFFLMLKEMRRKEQTE